MISDVFTTMSGTPTVSDLICAYDQAFGGLFIITSLILLFIVMVMSSYSISRDGLGSLLFSLFLTDFIAFILSIIHTDNCTPLLGYEWVVRFVVLTALVYIAKKVLD